MGSETLFRDTYGALLPSRKVKIHGHSINHSETRRDDVMLVPNGAGSPREGERDFTDSEQGAEEFSPSTLLNSDPKLRTRISRRGTIRFISFLLF